MTWFYNKNKGYYIPKCENCGKFINYKVIDLDRPVENVRAVTIASSELVVYYSGKHAEVCLKCQHSRYSNGVV